MFAGFLYAEAGDPENSRLVFTDPSNTTGECASRAQAGPLPREGPVDGAPLQADNEASSMHACMHAGRQAGPIACTPAGAGQQARQWLIFSPPPPACRVGRRCQGQSGHV